MKKESSRDSDSGDCQSTAATCFDHRTIILDWSGRKRGRLCKWRLAAQAQHTANAVDILESVNQYHDNKSLYDANMPSSTCEVHEKKGTYLTIANQRPQKLEGTIAGPIRKTVQTDLTMTSLRRWFASMGPKKSRTIPDNSGKKLLDCCREQQHSKWRCLGRLHSMRASRDASCTDAKIRLFNGIDSVVQGTRTMTTLL